MALSDYLWFFAVAGGPVVLGAAFVYALLRRRRLSRREKAERDKKTRELYREGR